MVVYRRTRQLHDRMCDMFEYDGVTYVWDEYDMLVPVDEIA